MFEWLCWNFGSY